MNADLYKLIMQSDLGPGTKVQALVVCELFEMLPKEKQAEVLSKAEKIVERKYHPLIGELANA